MKTLSISTKQLQKLIHRLDKIEDRLQKQETTQEPATQAEAETMEQCIKRHMAANEELTEEQAHAICEEERKPKQEGSTEEKALGEKLIQVMKEYTDASIQKAKENTEKRLAEVQKETEQELIDSIRKGLGLQKDPVVHLSEVEGLVRKILLDKSPHGKRTETITKDKPTEGEGAGAKPKIAKSEDIFKKLMEKKGATL